MKYMEVIDNIEDLNFKELELGNRFLIEDCPLKDNYTIDDRYIFSNLKFYVLSNIIFNCIYKFNYSISQITGQNSYIIDTYNSNNSTSTNYYQKGFDNNEFNDKYSVISNMTELSYLYIFNKKIELMNYNIYSYNSPINRIELINLINSSRSNIIFKKKIIKENNLMKLYLSIKINNSYLIIVDSYKINTQKYSWTKMQEIYLYENSSKNKQSNKSCEQIIKLNFKDDIINILDLISEIANNKKFKKYKETYQILNYDIKDYLNNPSIINKLYYELKPLDINKEDILKFYEPIFEDKYIIAHLESKYNNQNLYIINKEDISKDIIDKCKRKAKTVLKYKLNNLSNDYINIFTGEVKNKQSSIIYKDNEGLIIQNGYYKYYYTLIDDIYVIANWIEEEKISNRRKVMNKLIE